MCKLKFEIKLKYNYYTNSLNNNILKHKIHYKDRELHPNMHVYLYYLFNNTFQKFQNKSYFKFDILNYFMEYNRHETNKLRLHKLIKYY